MHVCVHACMYVYSECIAILQLPPLVYIYGALYDGREFCCAGDVCMCVSVHVCMCIVSV
jgi:hypothetical protein